MGTRERVRRMVRWVQNPVVTVAALVVLAVEVLLLPGYPAFSSTGLWLRYGPANPWAAARPTDTGWGAMSRIAEYYAIANPEGWRLIDAESESFDELGGILERAEERAVYVRVREHHRRTGAWAITSFESGHSIDIAPLGGGAIANSDDLAIRALVADRLPEHPWIDSVRTSDAITQHIVWSGVAHNGVTLLAAGSLLVSLGWVARTPGWIRARRAERALSRGRCPSCGYAIEGVDRCPECGDSIDDARARLGG